MSNLITEAELRHLAAKPYGRSAKPRFTQKQLATTARAMLPEITTDSLHFARYRMLFTYTRAWYGDNAAIGIYQWLKTQGDAINPKTDMNRIFQPIHWNTDPRDPNWKLYLDLLDRDHYRMDWGDACYYDQDKPVVVTYHDGREAVTDEWETVSTAKDGVVTRKRKEEDHEYDNALFYQEHNEVWRTKDPAKMPELMNLRDAARTLYHARVQEWAGTYPGDRILDELDNDITLIHLDAMYRWWWYKITQLAGENEYIALAFIKATHEDDVKQLARLILTEDVPRRIRANIVTEPVKVIARKGERTGTVVTIAPRLVRMMDRETRIRLADTIESDHRMAEFGEDPYYAEVTKLTGVRVAAPSNTSLGDWVDVERYLSDQGQATSYDRTLGLRDDNAHRLATRVKKAKAKGESIEAMVDTVDWLTFLGENIYDLSATRIVQTLRLILTQSVDKFWQAGEWLTDVYGEFNARTFMGIGESLESPHLPAPAAIAA